jgi:hypothetical protein
MVVGTDSLDARAEGVATAPSRPLTGRAEWRIEIDTLDWRPKWTIRLLLSRPDSGVVTIRWATTALPRAGSYEPKIVATGVSHADSRFVTVSYSVAEGGIIRSYLVGAYDERVIITRVAPNGSVAGSFSFLASRFSDEPPKNFLHSYATRAVSATFEAVAGGPLRAPTMTASHQKEILWRALDGFGTTWMGALNGDGDADSTHTPAKGRAFLASRWSAALTVDSLAASPSDYYLRVRGKFFPIVCAMTPHDLAPRCEPPR